MHEFFFDGQMVIVLVCAVSLAEVEQVMTSYFWVKVYLKLKLLPTFTVLYMIRLHPFQAILGLHIMARWLLRVRVIPTLPVPQLHPFQEILGLLIVP